MRTALLALILLLAACGPAGPPRSGTVIQRVYTPPISGSGYGFGTCSGANGVGTCSGVVFYSEGERWTLILRDETGDVWAEGVDPQVWAATIVGDTYP